MNEKIAKYRLLSIIHRLHVFGSKPIFNILITFYIHSRFGRWKSSMFFLAVRVIGDLLSMFAPNLPVLLLGRIILGTGLMSSYITTFVLSMLSGVYFCFFPLWYATALHRKEHIYAKCSYFRHTVH